jgi:hypothetical protein
MDRDYAAPVAKALILPAKTLDFISGPAQEPSIFRFCGMRRDSAIADHLVRPTTQFPDDVSHNTHSRFCRLLDNPMLDFGIALAPEGDGRRK